jgi:ketopantoate reductase
LFKPNECYRGKNIGDLLSDPRVKEEMLSLANETEAVGIKLGVIQLGDFKIDNFFSLSESKLAKHEPSMPQDFRAGKPLEIHRIIEVVIMLAELKDVEISIPTVHSVHRRLIKKIKK